jgi:hypothetical protein
MTARGRVGQRNPVLHLPLASQVIPRKSRGMAEPPKRFRVTARDNYGDIFAFESDNRERAEKKHRQLSKRPELHDVRIERQRWL